ncbi:nucleotidyltransferase domain protein [Clostridium tepidiprofundi DSM 19306]|uniref:Nucleotidyltransferase domain protein n=1 Tax=Clostridium tepidiprofundi DSM 19306 TaxID=1121338 RepID=A0A151B616_9CLOT|nr:nucleotidyltransferase domain-containing protein [Clostridium tepidiprofundi]KYH35087.1 nucleotidyltransferase domain protein [Clostridium tepidiprofundi DSM 19306]
MNTVMQYQKAFNTIVDRMKEDKNVLAVLVFGSMVSGDFWEESDIDMFVVIEGELDYIKNVYTNINDIPIHFRFINKSDFMKLHIKSMDKGYSNRLIASSKLVFSKDMDITTKYDQGRFYTDKYRGIKNLVYLGRVLAYISECKKYISNDVLPTAYNLAIKCVNDFSKLYVNFNGYTVTRDVLTMCINTNSEFYNIVNELFFESKDVKEAIENTLKYIENEIDNNLRNICYMLLDYMKEKDELLSSDEIRRDSQFYGFDIKAELILDRLFKKQIIKKVKRSFYLDSSNELFKENVYTI